jgi:hypothetical protein
MADILGELRKPMTSETDIEFGTLAVGTRFEIGTRVTFEKTSDREAKIVAGDDGLRDISYHFGLSKPVHVVSKE